MELSLSTSSVGGSSSQGNLSKTTGQWFSVRRIFRDFRRLGSRRQSRKVSGSRNRNDVINANSCSFYLDEEENSPSDDTSVALIECPVCTLTQPPSAFPVFASAQCHHRTCIDCMRRYLAVEITESRTEVACPVCAARIHPDDVRCFLAGDQILLHKYEEFTLRRALVVDPDVRWCPAPDCG
jgi:E3 ubiquitin-protein ligase RNF19A